MSKEKIVNARLQQKHDLEKNWMLAENFVPKIGELIVYDTETSIEDITDREGKLIRETLYSYPRLKIGDGVTAVNALLFIDEELNSEIRYAISKKMDKPFEIKFSIDKQNGSALPDKTFQELEGAYNNNENIKAYIIDEDNEKIPLMFFYREGRPVFMSPLLHSPYYETIQYYIERFEQDENQWECILSTALDLISIDYSVLAFDTTEIIIGGEGSTEQSSILGKATLGQLILG